jgi:hypothetical protein
MTPAVAAALILVAAAAAAVGLRGRLRRWRTVRRLKRAELEVEDAVADGRLARVTGETLLQHLEGLRRALAGGRGS